MLAAPLEWLSGQSKPGPPISVRSASGGELNEFSFHHDLMTRYHYHPRFTDEEPEAETSHATGRRLCLCCIFLPTSWAKQTFSILMILEMTVFHGSPFCSRGFAVSKQNSFPGRTAWMGASQTARSESGFSVVTLGLHITKRQTPHPAACTHFPQMLFSHRHNGRENLFTMAADEQGLGDT